MTQHQASRQDHARSINDRGEPTIAWYLAYVALVVRRLGWRSRGEAQKSGEAATADIAMKWLFENDTDPDAHPTPAKEDHALTYKALVWGRMLGGVDGNIELSDYESNLHAAVRGEFVTAKTAGIVASLITAYQRELERRKPNVSEHVGAIGERMLLLVRVRAIFEISGAYGTSAKHILVDADENVFVWKTTGQLVKDRLYILRASIDEHAVYAPKGRDGADVPAVKQTVLKRCKVERAFTKEDEAEGLPAKELAELVELDAAKPKKSRKNAA